MVTLYTPPFHRLENLDFQKIENNFLDILEGRHPICYSLKRPLGSTAGVLYMNKKIKHHRVANISTVAQGVSTVGRISIKGSEKLIVIDNTSTISAY